MTSLLSIHNLRRLTPREIVQFRGEPVEVVTVPKHRRSITVKPVDGGRKFRVTRDELIEREQRFDKARKQFGRKMRHEHETVHFIFITP